MAIWQISLRSRDSVRGADYSPDFGIWKVLSNISFYILGNGFMKYIRAIAAPN